MSLPVSFRTQAMQIARKDLRVEARVGEVLLITIPFGAVALLLVPLAVGPELELLGRIGPGMFWVVVLLFGMVITFRQTAAEGPAQRDLLALLGLDPAAQFTGRALASGVLLLVFEALLAPVAVVLYNPPLPAWWWLGLIGPLVAAGLALLGSLAGGLTSNLRVRSTLAPLLVAPLAVPLLLAATASLEGLRYGSDILAWVLLLATFDLILAIAGVWTARSLEEGSR
ncbi:MAG: heme exporter protein CcmB [Actinomycetota bacterium]|nr:heme exporter protein CcmB [Actinomycetota bacterium]